jgi:hypothetical protein
MQRQQQEIWFSYARTAGRITAKPANWRGWVALSIALAVNLIFVLIVWAAAATIHPLAGPASLFVSLPLGLLMILKMVLAKGRRVA